MANIVPYTEDCSQWTPTNVVVTTNTHAAPSTSAVGAGLADTVDDQSSSLGSVTFTDQAISSDASSWTASVYVRKDAITSRTPEFLIRFGGGTLLVAGISFDTSTGTVSSPASVQDADASGVVDVDTNWWRVWYRKANNNSGNTAIRLILYPAAQGVIDTGASSTATGSIVVWGVNLTNTSSVQTYEPNPAYGTPPMILIRHTF